MILDFAMTSLSGSEGELVEVCVVVTSFPTGGVEIPVTLELGTRDGTKAGWSLNKLNIDIGSDR